MFFAEENNDDMLITRHLLGKKIPEREKELIKTTVTACIMKCCDNSDRLDQAAYSIVNVLSNHDHNHGETIIVLLYILDNLFYNLKKELDKDTANESNNVIPFRKISPEEIIHEIIDSENLDTED